ncbi:transglycosylase SLT domain-containing protein [Fibrobacter sp. UWB10]|uniref:lytic transglycosylase domain-containing protein n=1 Tax=Fibrobacter sp. UWB10 TaxID=1896201 RepID=UPI00156B14D5|nr:transglycosylase SLT domain-containing protein [Fibrobacter sp. UWB10]MBO7513347.1 transglycosylase SLT domain-containing protein [Fibrobacter sp.]SMP55926.1 Transglycosylase SLT domain-containing protein [Fibrobacter sp. UWB10]
MKSNVRISKLTFAIALVLCFGALGLFVSYWYARQAEIKELAVKESVLRGELEQLSAWGKWTIDYVKISRALDYLSQGRLTEEQREMLTEQIWQISRSYATDPLLILAVVAQESRGNPNARGRKQSGAFSGALGLMQIKLETAKKMGAHFGLNVETEEDLLKPEINVTVGTAYLIRLISKYGNWKDALIAYNLGHSAVDRMLESGKPLPTKYYEHVISKYRNLLSLEF